MVVLNVAPGGSGVGGSIPFPGAGATGGSEIYRIAPDGSPSRIWTSREDLVYALAFDPSGRLLAGTGNRGHIFAITGEDQFRRSAQGQRRPRSRLSPRLQEAGCMFQPAISAKFFCWADRRSPRAVTRAMCLMPRSFPAGVGPNSAASGKVDLFARSGNVDNPDRNWSPWKPIDLQKDAATERSTGALCPVEGGAACRHSAPRRGQRVAELPAQECSLPTSTTLRCR